MRADDEVAREDAELQADLNELSKALYMCSHEGLLDPNKPPWEQNDEEVQSAWRRVAHPRNVAALPRQIGSGGTSEWNDRIQKAYEQACRK